MEGQIITNCQEEGVNTGSESCIKTEGKTLSLIITDSNALYPIDPATFKGDLDKYVSASGVLRMLPINNIIANTPNGGDIATSEIGFAGAKPVGLNGYNEAYQVNAGDCFYKEIAKLNKRTVRTFRIDDEGYIYGTVVYKNGVYYFAGFLATAYALRTKGTDNSTLAAITLTLYYGVNYESELKKLNAFEVDNVPDGLLGVTLQRVAAGEAKVVGQCGGTDFTETFGSEWDATMFVNSAGANPTSVTYDATKGILTFVPIASYRVAGASILNAGDVTGIDGVNSYTSLT